MHSHKISPFSLCIQTYLYFVFAARHIDAWTPIQMWVNQVLPPFCGSRCPARNSVNRCYPNRPKTERRKKQFNLISNKIFSQKKCNFMQHFTNVFYCCCWNFINLALRQWFGLCCQINIRCSHNFLNTFYFCSQHWHVSIFHLFSFQYFISVWTTCCRD